MRSKTKTEVETPVVKIPMALLKNISFQGFEIFTKKGRDYESHWLEPGATVEVPANSITSSVKYLVRKRMLDMTL